MIRRHDGFVPDNVRSRLQKVLEAVADDHPSAPLLSGLGPKGIDEAHADLVVLARACRTGTRSLLADEVVPTPKALAQRPIPVAGKSCFFSTLESSGRAFARILRQISSPTESSGRTPRWRPPPSSVSTV